MANEPQEIVFVKTRTVACDGGEGALGHPLVYLNLGSDHQVECPYCDRLFKLDSAKTKAA